jgi:pimeloyl-ACP methyl ester carboxylesterase
VDTAFYTWNAAWLDPGSRNWRIDERLSHIRVPILIVQGSDDQYGTIAQLQVAEQETYCPVETLVLENCRHSPHLDQPAVVRAAVARFADDAVAARSGSASGP